MVDGRHIKYRFLAISSVHYWPINAKFGKGMKYHVQILVTWPKWFIILYHVGLRTILRLFLLCIVWLRLSTIMI